MSLMLKKLWNDDQGALIAMEFLFVATILVLGILAGIGSVRSAINAELAELSNAILALSQGYSIGGQQGCCATVDGSQAIDTPGLVPGALCTPAAIPSVIDVTAACN
jgi:Flp pilus assembly pilin Flp